MAELRQPTAANAPSHRRLPPEPPPSQEPQAMAKLRCFQVEYKKEDRAISRMHIPRLKTSHEKHHGNVSTKRQTRARRQADEMDRAHRHAMEPGHAAATQRHAPIHDVVSASRQPPSSPGPSRGLPSGGPPVQRCATVHSIAAADQSANGRHEVIKAKEKELKALRLELEKLEVARNKGAQSLWPPPMSRAQSAGRPRRPFDEGNSKKTLPKTSSELAQLCRDAA